jgi:hypothetical protein
MALCLTCFSVCSAQPAAPPKILLLVRQQFKPGKVPARERLERATSAVYNRLEVPVYWMEMQAFTGPPEALFFAPYDSFEAIEKALPVLGPFEEAHPELIRWQDGINDSLASERTILAVRRDTSGVDRINLAQARFLRMLVVRTSAGADAPMLDNAAVYQVNSGMPGPAFLVFQPMAAFADLPVVRLTAGTIVEDSVYAIEPDLSHVSRAFAEQDPSFWMKPAGQ